MSSDIFGCIICGYAINGPETSATGSWLKEFRASMASQVCDQDSALIHQSIQALKGPTSLVMVGMITPMMAHGSLYLISPCDGTTMIISFQLATCFQSCGNIQTMVSTAFCYMTPAGVFFGKPENPTASLSSGSLRYADPCHVRFKESTCVGATIMEASTFFDSQYHYPWEDRLMEKYNSPETHQYAKENPYDVPEIPGLLVMRSKISPHFVPKTRGEDCFSTLPWEILEIIAINLPTTGDALTLRRASKAFLPILTSQAFWASRFKVGYDCDFIFELRDNRELRDWITLYRMTNPAHSPPRLKNRKRVWGLIRVLTNLLRLRMDDALESSCTNLSADGLRWNEVAGDVKQATDSGYCERFNEGCRLFRKQCASIPSDLSRIAFSVARAGNDEYIAGMRLITSNDADIRLGYIAEGNELFLDVAAVGGFVLAMGPRGIRALRVISGDGRASKWFGCPKDSPVTERLTGFKFISALEVGVDVSTPVIPFS